MQGMNVASTLRKSQGQSELGRGSSPLAQHLQSGNGSRENVDAFSGLRINTGAPNQQQQRQDVMDLDNEDQGDESPDLGGHGMQDEMLEEDEEAEFSCAVFLFL